MDGSLLSSLGVNWGLKVGEQGQEKGQYRTGVPNSEMQRESRAQRQRSRDRGQRQRDRG